MDVRAQLIEVHYDTKEDAFVCEHPDDLPVEFAGDAPDEARVLLCVSCANAYEDGARLSYAVRRSDIPAYS